MGIWDNDHSNKKDYGNSNKEKSWGSKPSSETSTWVVNVNKNGNSSWNKKSEKKEWF